MPLSASAIPGVLHGVQDLPPFGHQNHCFGKNIGIHLGLERHQALEGFQRYALVCGEYAGKSGAQPASAFFGVFQQLHRGEYLVDAEKTAQIGNGFLMFQQTGNEPAIACQQICEIAALLHPFCRTAATSLSVALKSCACSALREAVLMTAGNSARMARSLAHAACPCRFCSRQPERRWSGRAPSVARG